MTKHLHVLSRAVLPVLLGLLVLTGCEQSTLFTASDEADLDNAGLSKNATAEALPGRFIVTVREGEAPAALASEHGIEPDFVYTHVLNGFAGKISDAAREGLLRDNRILRVEADGVVHAITTTQSDATWGLDRVDQRENALNGTYTYNTTGTGVTAYIIDTGILTTHDEFGGRAVHGYDSVDDDFDATDCNGHGTHVAGTVGGALYGVAKAIDLVAVRVLDCGGSGTWSGVIAGMDWVTANHAAGAPAVANMSLGGGANSSVDDAVQRMIDDGISTSVAAGNGNQGGKEQDACGYSPARVPDAMTIGATSQSDSKTSWSNYGDCVDWFAPGYQITSAWYTSNSDTKTISGTSMSAPHVAGVAALYLEANTGASALEVRNALYDATTKNIVTNSKTANNHLLYSLVADGSSDGTTNNPPVASFTYSCSGLDCSFDGSGSTDDGGASNLTYSWDFGDGQTGSGATASHAYSGEGTYTVTLTVTDSGGLADMATKDVAVTETSSTGITLEGNGYKVKGKMTVDLTWAGATSTSVDIWRKDGSAGSFNKIIVTENDGAHTDNTNYVGGGTLTYKLCEAGSSTCSDEVAVVF